MAGAPLIAGVQVRVAGTDLGVDFLREVRVEQHMLLPDTFSFALVDPLLEHVDEQRFAPGTDVEISFAGPDQVALAPVIAGKIAAVEPEFGPDEAVLTVRGYDVSHQLNRSPKNRAFQNMTYGDIARKVAQEAGLRIGKVDPTGGPIDFVQQSNETDWRFLWRLAVSVDFVIAIENSALQFRKAATAPPGRPLALVWGQTLRQLRPRVSGVQQVDSVTVNGWDPKAKQAITANVNVGAGDGEIGLTRAAAASGLDGGEVTVADHPVSTSAEAKALAEATAARVSNAYLEADGIADGDPRIKAGSRLSIDGVGRRFGGTYVVTAAQHVYRGTTGYETRFMVSGRSTRTLLDLMAPPGQRPWGEGLVVGVVTNNKDPDGLARVRVRYPVLGQTVESWWARVAAPGAGAGRGALMMPVAGDEVVVGFEHGDPRRPYVLGSLFNGKAKPQALAHPDGSLHVHSDKELLLEAQGAMTVTGDKDLNVTVKGKKSEDVTGEVALKSKAKIGVNAGGPLQIEAKGPTAIKGATVNLESTAAMTIKAKGTLSIECAGVLRLSGSQIVLG